MTEQAAIEELLTAAVYGAADIAQARIGRHLEVVAGDAGATTALLRFDLTFTSGGTLSWFVSNEDATGFADLIIGGEGDRTAILTEMHLDALSGLFSDMLERAVDAISIKLVEPVVAGGVDMGMEGELPVVPVGGHQTALALEIDGFGPLTIIQQVDQGMAQTLNSRFMGSFGAAAAKTPPPAPAPEASEDLAAAADAAIAEGDPAPAGPEPQTQAAPTAHGSDNVVPLPHVVAASNTPARPTSQRDLQMLMNVPLPLTVELGHTQRTIRELVEMGVGSIIELSKLAGDPLDIKVNDRVIARGEVVVIDEEFGIRVTEIVSPADRLQGLG